MPLLEKETEGEYRNKFVREATWGLAGLEKI